MKWQGVWGDLRRGYSRVNTFLEAFYRHGASDPGVQGVVREFLEGRPDGVHLTWARDRHGPICHARDARGTYRIELQRHEGRWRADVCSCLGFQEFRRECRHLRSVRQAIASRGGDLPTQDS